MPPPYNPNSEATNTEQVIAGHWELLRRNGEFRLISKRWLASEEFRHTHALSPHYHDMQHHTPRCAWDWMLTATQRVRLAKFQIEKEHWVPDRRFNFGPITLQQPFSMSTVTRENHRDKLGLVRAEPIPDPPPPISADHSWNGTPDLFKQQFRLAHNSRNEFGEINSRLDELAKHLRVTANRLASGDPLKERPIIAHYLFEFGTELHELAEFSKVFKIPKSRYSGQRFKQFLGEIHDSFKRYIMQSQRSWRSSFSPVTILLSTEPFNHASMMGLLTLSL